MKTSYLFFFVSIYLLAFSYDSFGQEPTFEWVKQSGGAGGSSWGSYIAIDQFNNVYTTGTFEGSIDFDPGSGTFNLTSFGGDDVFVQKLDMEGNLIWAVQIGGNQNDNYFHGGDIVVDSEENVYVSSSFQGTADFDPGAGAFNMTSLDDTDAFVIKLNSSGDFVWAKQFGGNDDQWCTGIGIDVNADVFVTGNFYGNIDMDPGAGTNNYTAIGDADMFMLKLDTDGNFIWAKHIGGNSYVGFIDMVVDNEGNSYMSGSFVGVVDFDSGIETLDISSTGGWDPFIIKIDPFGELLWAKVTGGSGGDGAWGIAIDYLGNVYATGDFSSTVDFDPGPEIYEVSTNGGHDSFVQKLDSDGNFVWAKNIGGPNEDWGHSIAVDLEGNVYSAGLFKGNADFDPGPGVFQISSSGGYEHFIQKLDSEGNFVWAGSFGGGENDRYKMITVKVDAFKNVYSTSRFESTTDFDPGFNSFELTSIGSHDLFVHKMSQCNIALNIDADGDTNICQGESVILTANGSGNYLWSTGDTTNSITVSPQLTSNYSVVVLDGTGCFGSETIQITVEPHPNAQFDYSSIETTVEFSNLSSSNATDFEWNFGDNSPESNEENPVHIYEQPGVYLVTLVATNPLCGSAISQYVDVFPTSTKTLDHENLIEIFPNPATEILTIKSEIQLEFIKISNALGQQVFELKTQKPIEQIDVRGLQSGIYVIHFLIGEVIITTEFVKL